MPKIYNKIGYVTLNFLMFRWQLQNHDKIATLPCLKDSTSYPFRILEFVKDHVPHWFDQLYSKELLGLGGLLVNLEHPLTCLEAQLSLKSFLGIRQYHPIYVSI